MYTVYGIYMYGNLQISNQCLYLAAKPSENYLPAKRVMATLFDVILACKMHYGLLVCAYTLHALPGQ